MILSVTSWEHLGDILEISWRHFANILVKSWGYLVDNLGISWGYLGFLLSERISGVSPVILNFEGKFSLSISCWLHREIGFVVVVDLKIEFTTNHIFWVEYFILLTLKINGVCFSTCCWPTNGAVLSLLSWRGSVWLLMLIAVELYSNSKQKTGNYINFWYLIIPRLGNQE